jgi:hypothetical protein
MKRILITGVIATSLIVSASASAASTPMYLTDNLGQLLAPVTSTLLPSQPGVMSSITMTSPATGTSTSRSLASDLTTNDSPVASTDTYHGPINAVDMNSSFLTLVPASHVSSYSYPSLKLSSKSTNELYATSAGLLAFGLIFAFGLLERAQAVNLGRLTNKKASTETIV